MFAAIGLAWARDYQSCEIAFESFPDPDESPPALYRIRVLSWWFVLLSHFVAAITAGALILRMRRPHPSIRQLVRRPGAVACGAATFAIGLELAFSSARVVIGLARGIPIQDAGQITCHCVSGYEEMLAVAVAWLLMVARRSWRRERSWIDDLGICVGAWWLAIPVVLGLASFVAEVFWI